MPSWTRFLVFMTVGALLSTLLHYYVWARLVRDAALPLAWARPVTAALIGFGIALPLGMALPMSRSLPRSIGMPLAAVIYTWMGLLFLLFVGLVGGDLLRLAIGLFDRARGAPVDDDRRGFLLRGIAAIVGFGALTAGGWGIFQARGPISTRRVKVALRRLPESMRGLTLAQISDLHVGPTIGRDFVADVVARTNALRADAIVLTGDIVDGSVEKLREAIAPLADLQAPLGVFFVTGNHEYYSGADAWLAELARMGIRPLRNERVELRRGDDAIDLAGVDDYSAHGFGGDHGPDLPRALAGRDATRALVLLAHQPRAFPEAARLGVGLQLSGHTHGGQIWPWSWLVKLQQPYVAGLHRLGEAQIYVSCGTGYWGPPMRVGAPPEITQLTLEPA